MEWSPNSHFLLAAGITPACSVDSCLFSTHWLIDVQNDLVMATLDLAEGSTSRHTTFEWLPDNGGVVFYAMDGVAIGNVTPRTKVTLYSDGKVTKEPVTYEEWNTFTFLSPEETNERDEQFTSPQGRYLIGRATITDTETGVEAPLFTGMWSESEVGYLDAVDWHPSEEWAFLTFERGEGYFVTVLFKTDGTYQRELCTCYPGPNLIGWLPDNVDVDSIPLLADAP